MRSWPRGTWAIPFLLVLTVPVARAQPETPAQPPPDEEPAPAQPVSPASEPPSERAQVGPDVPPEPQSTLTVYGFAMLDLGFDFGKIGDPAWQDVLRPTKLPAFPDEFGKGPRWFEGVRQSRFGVSWKIPTEYGDVTTKFEFELFGVGV